MLLFFKYRRGIAMIELIFAIVVIGIVMMSVPNLSRISSRSTYTTLQQESIAEAASALGLMSTLSWDENSKGAVVKTESPNIPACSPSRPQGVTALSGRPCVDKNASILGSATDTGEPTNSPIEFDDVDDYRFSSRVVSVPGAENSYTTSSGDIIDTEINVTVTVTYGNDAAPGTAAYPNPFNGNLPAGVNTTNIKLISVLLRSTNVAEEINTKQIRMSAFMCNIGAPKTIITRVVP
jgi:type II secretory pathway pseudopilin PulG